MKKNLCFLRLVLALVIIMMILALVIGFMFDDCKKDMSTCLLVYGFIDLIMCTLFMIIFYRALVQCCATIEKRSYDNIIIIILWHGYIIFNIAWTIYGAFLFLPAVASDPICSNDKDGKVLVVTGTIIVAFKIIFCFFQILIMPTNVNVEKSSSGSVHITNWSNRMESLELQAMNIGIDVEQDPGRVDDVPGDPVHENKLVTILKALGRNLMFS